MFKQNKRDFIRLSLNRSCCRHGSSRSARPHWLHFERVPMLAFMAGEHLLKHRGLW